MQSPLKFRDLSESFDKTAPVESAKEHYPEIRINLDKLPELDGDVGDTGEVSFMFEIVSKREDEFENCVSLKLESGAVISITKPKTEKSPSRLPDNEVDGILQAMEGYNPRGG